MKKLMGLFVFLAFVGLQIVNAQSNQISGTVISSDDGLGMPGVSVIIKGTTTGASTDIDGKYTLMAEPTDILVFSFVGMVTQEITVGNKTVIDVKLETESIGVDEVVVTAIGIKRETKALGYSVESVDEDEIAKSATTNVVNALSGKVAGVQVTNSAGTAGGPAYITIRGSASLTGNNQPLFVVDGVPIDNSSQSTGSSVGGVQTPNRAIDLNPDDIASMSVLKGGAATALYGLRAANGAIIITTKKGSKGKIRVNVGSSVSLDKISQTPELQTKYAQGYNGQYSGPETGMSVSWGPKLSELEYDGDPNYKWNPQGRIVAKGSGNGTPIVAPDHYDFFQTGVTFNNSVDVSGGGEKGTFYLSASNRHQEGIVPNNQFDKTTFKMSGEADVSDKVKIGGSANYINSKTNAIQQGSNTSGVMLGLTRTPPSFDNAAGYEFEDGTQRNYRGGGGYDNPYWTVNKNHYEENVDRLLGNFNVNWQPTDWMTVSYRLGIDWYSRRFKDVIAKYSRANSKGYVGAGQSTTRDINSTLLINMRKDFSESFSTTLNLGHDMSERYYSGLSGTANGINIIGFEHLSNTSSNTVSEASSKLRRGAFFFDAGLSYKNMFFVNVTGRNEWSTTLPKANNSFFYPSVSSGFIFTELDAFKNQTFLTFGKLRASYAIIANDAPAYMTANSYYQGSYGDGSTDGIEFPGWGVNSYSLSGTMGNPELKPEKMKNFEIGADLRFFNSRLNFDVAYFKNVNSDLLLSVPIASSTGFSARFMNAGEMETKGWEILVNANPIKTSDFSWDVTLSYSQSESVVTKLAEGVENVFLGGFVSSQIRAVEGRPYKTIYSTVWQRNDEGQLLIDDQTGHPMESTEKTYVGDVDPDFTLNVTNSFSYKNWSLSFLIDWKKGGMMWNGTRGALTYMGTAKETENREAGQEVIIAGEKGHYDDGGNWISSGANDIAILKDQSYYIDGPGSGWTGPAEDFVEDSSWVRLRELTLSYRFGQNILEKTGFLKKLELYFTGRNLWLDTDYSGVDPETSLTGNSNAQGMDYFNMPGTKTYTFGVKMSF